MWFIHNVITLSCTNFFFCCQHNRLRKQEVLTKKMKMLNTGQKVAKKMQMKNMVIRLMQRVEMVNSI